MDEQSILRATTFECIKDTTIADLPEGRTIILYGKPTEEEGAIFKDKAPVVEKWIDEDGKARTIGRYATILYDTVTREFSVILPDQEITGLQPSGIENDNYMILTTKESDEEQTSIILTNGYKIVNQSTQQSALLLLDDTHNSPDEYHQS